MKTNLLNWKEEEEDDEEGHVLSLMPQHLCNLSCHFINENGHSHKCSSLLGREREGGEKGRYFARPLSPAFVLM